MTCEELEKKGVEKKDKEAIYYMGRKLIEGCWLTNCPVNEKKGLTWLKENAKNGHLKSEEYLTYYDMKFNPHFNMKKIIATLEKAAPLPHSPQAATTLGELYYMQAKKKPELLETSLKYYEMAAKFDCGYGQYWVGYLNALHLKKHDIAFNYFTKSHKKGNINATYQLFLLHSKAPEYLNVVKAYKYLRKCVEFAIPCQDELNAYFKDHIAELKSLDESWKSWSDEDLIKIHTTEINKLAQKLADARQTDKLYKRPSALFMDNNGNWFLSMQTKNFIKNALTYKWQDFILCLKEELLPIFSGVGLFILENWLARAKQSKKETKKAKVEAIENAIELVNLYIADGTEGLLEKVKKSMKKEKMPMKPRIKYLYIDYIHPSYFIEQEETSQPSIVCASCKKQQGDTKFDMCSACKKVYYCSRECQLKDWKAGHKNQCPLLREAKA